MVVAVSGLAITSNAQAQEAGLNDVTIEAVYPTAIGGLEDLVFDVTIGSAPDEDLLVLVTLSSGILSALERTVPVLILEGSTTTRLSLSTRILMQGATTGDVTATVVDGDHHDVGDPSTATVRVFVGETAVDAKVGFDAPVYRLDESVGTTTDQIRLTVRTVPGTPVPRNLTVPVWTRGDTATSGDDYSNLSGTVTFLPPWTTEETPDGDVYSAHASVPVTIVEDDESEGDERFTIWVGFPTESPNTVSLTATDAAPECDSSGCGSYVVITDNDDEVIILDEDSGDVTIEARHPTALQGIDDIVFFVTRSVVNDTELEVPVTLSPGIIHQDRLSQTVTIPAGETRAPLEVHTRTLDPNAMTGEVTATITDGDGYDVGDPSSATIRLHVGETLVTVRLSAASYALDEDVGTTTDQIKLIVQTAPGVPIPVSRISVSISSVAVTATSPDDYAAVSEQLGLPRSTADWAFASGGDAFVAEVPVPLTIVDDDEFEDDETLELKLERVADTPATVALVTANPGSPCDGDCESQVTINDNELPPGSVVVTLVHVPDGTVIPDDSTVGVGATVVDGTTFSEDQRVYFRLLFEAGDGGPAPGGANVELRFEWHHNSPIVPTSGEISLIELSLPRVDVWDSAVQILDNDIGNPDSTMTARITGCKRNGCVIGTPSEITVTIADDDGGPAAAPPGPPDPPSLLCASSGDGYDSNALAVSWHAPSFEGGAPIQDYDVRYHRRDPDERPWPDVWEPWPHTGTGTKATITGLDVDALYEVQVRAVNANGPGQWSLPNASWTGYSEDFCEILDELALGS